MTNEKMQRRFKHIWKDEAHIYKTIIIITYYEDLRAFSVYCKEEIDNNIDKITTSHYFRVNYEDFIACVEPYAYASGRGCYYEEF